MMNDDISKANKILMIEDDQLLVKMYKTKLELEDFEVVIASDGKDGLQKIRKGKPDLILLDLMMPKMDGFEFLETLKHRMDENVEGIPIVVFTNLGQESDIKKAKELGAADYLVKANLTPQQVTDKVKEHLKNDK